MYEYRIKSEWNHYLPLLQQIINYTVYCSIETQLGRVIFGDMVDLWLNLPEGYAGRNDEDYLIKLHEAQSILIQATQDYLKKHKRKRAERNKLQRDARFARKIKVL